MHAPPSRSNTLLGVKMNAVEPNQVESPAKRHHWAVENAATIGLVSGIILGIIVGFLTGKMHQSIMVLLVVGLSIGTLALIATSSEDH